MKECIMKVKINHTFLIQCLYFLLAATTAFQKIIEFKVPDWFILKFSNSFIGIIPFGITISFIIITILESTIAITMLVSILYKEYLISSNKAIYNLALDLSLVLFVILFFGSFLVSDYTNGALDFIYFIGTLIIRKKLIN